MHCKYLIVELLCLGLPNVINDTPERNLVLNIKIVLVVKTVDNLHELKLSKLRIKVEYHFVVLWANDFIHLDL